VTPAPEATARAGSPFQSISSAPRTVASPVGRRTATPFGLLPFFRPPFWLPVGPPLRAPLARGPSLNGVSSSSSCSME
jgi:hypothetical protein